MKLRKMLSVQFLSTALSAVALAQAPYQAGDYGVDSMHSNVGFEVPHLVISSVEGKFLKYEGNLKLDQKFEKSKVSFLVDIASIDTSVKKRDDHLKSPDFFDAAKYPNMKFESSEISGTPDSFKLIGQLTIKGVTKKISFDSHYLGSVKDGYGNQKVAFTAKTKISRKEFGLTWNNVVEAGPVVGDEITITLKIQAAKIEKK